MFDTIKRMINIIDVTQSNTHITISGVNGYLMAKDILGVWGTSRITTYMFTMGRSFVRFPSFFAVDALYIFKTLAEDKFARYPHRNYYKIVELIKENTWLSHTENKYKTRLDLSRLNVFVDNIKPDGYQFEFLSVYDQKTRQYDLNGYILAAAPGSGKTLMSLFLFYALGLDVFIEIVPMNAVLEVWDKTISTSFKTTPKYWHSLMPGDPPLDCKHYIFHYEALNRLEPFLRRLKSKSLFIGIDESHNFNDPDSLRTKLLVESVKVSGCTDILPMSGTPIKALGSETVPIFRMIDKYWTNDVEARFKKIYGKEAKRGNDIIRHRIGEYSYKVDVKFTNHEVHVKPPIMVKLPNPHPYLLETIKAEMRAFITERREFYKKHMAKYVSIYNDAMSIHSEWVIHHGDVAEFNQYTAAVKKIKDFYDPVSDKEIIKFANLYEAKTIIPNLPKEIKKEFKDAKSVVKYVDLKIMGEALGTVLNRKRVDCHLDMIPHMELISIITNARKKTLIFSSYVEVVDGIVEYLKENGIKALYVHGENSSEIKDIIAEFERDESIDAMVSTYKSLSTAVPMVMASDTVFTNPPFRDHERKQAIARTDRRGQDGDVNIWDILLDTGNEPNISTRSNDIMTWSKEQVEQIMGIHAPLDMAISLESIELNTSFESLFSLFKDIEFI